MVREQKSPSNRNPTYESAVKPLEPSPKKICTGPTGGHTYHIIESPKKLMKRLEKSSEQKLLSRKKLKASQKKLRRLNVKVKVLTTVVKQLHEKQTVKNVLAKNCLVCLWK